jgi:hypothetical protein
LYQTNKLRKYRLGGPSAAGGDRPRGINFFPVIRRVGERVFHRGWGGTGGIDGVGIRAGIGVDVGVRWGDREVRNRLTVWGGVGDTGACCQAVTTVS